jgi:aspartyl-tRNA(Asn)/glutamyl-tRNA(Gln) amidotransferase subunit A
MFRPMTQRMLAIVMPEASAYHQQAMRATPELFSDETRLLLEAGELMPATTYINAQRSRFAIKNAFKQAIRDIDVLVTPTQPMTALKIGQTTSRIGSREESVFGVSARLCAPFNISGLPAISVPCGFSPQGMPIGLQIIGKPFDEETLCSTLSSAARNGILSIRRSRPERIKVASLLDRRKAVSSDYVGAPMIVG